MFRVDAIFAHLVSIMLGALLAVIAAGVGAACELPFAVATGIAVIVFVAISAALAYSPARFKPHRLERWLESDSSEFSRVAAASRTQR